MFKSKTNTFIATVATIASMLGFGYMMQPGTKTADNIISAPTYAANKTVNVKDLMVAGSLPDHVMGNKDAKVTIVEYSSLTCPHCAHFHAKILPTVKKDYIKTGKVNYILREFPLDNLALTGFKLARCAPADKYYPFIEMMYKQQDVWAFTKKDRLPIMLKLAKGAGFTKASFEACIKDEKLHQGINEKRAQGIKFGINSTPSFFVNGELFNNIHDAKEFAKVLDAKLK